MSATANRFWSPGFVALMAGALAALVVLIGLGNWQVRRLAWKEALIETIESRRAADPAPPAEVLAEFEREGDVDYVPTRVSGTFEPGEALVYSTDQGIVGWQVVSPLRLADGRALMVNRGFVPDELIDETARRAPPDEPVEIEGLARNPLFDKPNTFVPENKADEFYWKDFAALRAALGLSEGETVPIMLDAGPTTEGELPVGGQTIVSLPNNHFGYAVTWYGIAVALVGVVAALSLQRRRRLRG